jgi:acyl-coenzyme A thioesterase PaaI-like protein
VPPLTEFDRATAVAARDGHSIHDVTVDPGWTIGDKPHGGYLLAILARAAADTAAAVEGPAHPHPLAATATYVAPPALGPAEVHSEVLHRGRGMSQVRARLVQAGTTRVEAAILLVRQRAGLVEARLVDEVCEVWDGRGRLVAHATQLAAIRTR